MPNCGEVKLEVKLVSLNQVVSVKVQWRSDREGEIK